MKTLRIKIKQKGRIDEETISTLRFTDDSWKYKCVDYGHGDMAANFGLWMYRRKKRKLKAFEIWYVIEKLLRLNEKLDI